MSSKQRQQAIKALLSGRADRLLDVGCGPVIPSYPYKDAARTVTCVDWKLHKIEPTPANVQCFEGDFITMGLPIGSFDTIIAADVFEHIQIEDETAFSARCYSLLKDEGMLIVSVPHKGTFAWLDPYNLKPIIHRLLWRFGLYKTIHNGSCDIRKGHKHYSVEELKLHFPQFTLDRATYWGYFFDPIETWIAAVSRGRWKFVSRFSDWECQYNWGERSFNMAVRLRKIAT